MYEFYDEKLVMHYSAVTELSYSSIAHVYYKMNIFDRWFKTGSIIIITEGGKIFKLKHLENPNQAYLLVQKHAK